LSTATASAQLYTLSLHDALPIFLAGRILGIDAERVVAGDQRGIALAELPVLARILEVPGELLGDEPDVQRLCCVGDVAKALHIRDRKSTRLNSSHVEISYAVFCL